MKIVLDKGKSIIPITYKDIYESGTDYNIEYGFEEDSVYGAYNINDTEFIYGAPSETVPGIHSFTLSRELKPKETILVSWGNGQKLLFYSENEGTEEEPKIITKVKHIDLISYNEIGEQEENKDRKGVLFGDDFKTVRPDNLEAMIYKEIK